MPNVMIRKDEAGKMTLYVAKRDLEEDIVSIEHEAEDRWGGEITLADGSSYYVEPLTAAPSLPITVRAKRGEAG
ncbi:MAG: putative nitrogen fixation protein NifT [Pseudomonadales bacterium]|jgi:nitrogen fixation protein NifT|uniref:putative nitrogen fixation protein NifT n=1 Tax=unclassified Ketobacter TaxID=2639109 RepID=UPI000C92043C|nr:MULTISPECIES: putative nitrogen fixation protein NifT [unclassified Ketobacter]MAA60614.1 putative nitrogen fixation protein NifT [Pseudomonadales bacterium]MEC8810250.1 putative nitrogen fixation protein NifT [Pseudomonadota bacterium]TNC88902.1 MAG: putative nitrogen fixation protein NifT [Alcanivorax sp.]HAG94404.1 putative nitrogen fixation protein NifT [Gammaproteobacteria bacterium]MAQ22986.1 putative nitrogen fixation protein NifT [Pseudomonadales bacterium]